jgi:monooxygenase
MSLEHVDVLIVGAGLSGIGAGYHLQANCPGKTYAILEGRDCIGGTWDLFRYPGIRSDSDMYRLCVQALGGGQVDRRRTLHPRLRPPDGR